MLDENTWKQAGSDALRLLEAREFEAGRALFESVLAVSGQAPPLMVLVYAVCLSELGDSERAAALAGLVKDEPTVAPVWDQVSRWLPGGKMDRKRRDALQGEAEKWLPRGQNKENS